MGHDLEALFDRPPAHGEDAAWVQRLRDDAAISTLFEELTAQLGLSDGVRPDLVATLHPTFGPSLVRCRMLVRWGVFLGYADGTARTCDTALALCRAVARCLGATRMILASDQGLFSGLEHGAVSAWSRVLEIERSAAGLRLLDPADMASRCDGPGELAGVHYSSLFYAESLASGVSKARRPIEAAGRDLADPCVSSDRLGAAQDRLVDTLVRPAALASLREIDQRSLRCRAQNCLRRWFVRADAAARSVFAEDIRRRNAAAALLQVVPRAELVIDARIVRMWPREYPLAVSRTLAGLLGEDTHSRIAAFIATVAGLDASEDGSWEHGEVVDAFQFDVLGAAAHKLRADGLEVPIRSAGPPDFYPTVQVGALGRLDELLAVSIRLLGGPQLRLRFRFELSELSDPATERRVRVALRSAWDQRLRDRAEIRVPAAAASMWDVELAFAD